MSRVLGVIPARGGSKGVPRKNLRILAGRPLLAYTADAARGSSRLTRTIVSTDDAEIADSARQLGLDVPFMRPAALAGDDTLMLPVLQHAWRAMSDQGFVADVVVLLQPTSPLRTPEHIRGAVRQLRESNADSVVTVTELPRHLSPDYVMRLDAGRLVPFLPEGGRIARRQDARPAFVRDGTVYAFWRRTLRDSHTIYGTTCSPLVVPARESITLDTAEDWDEAERRISALASAGRR